MRKVAAGLGSLVVAAGLTTGFALSAGASQSPRGTTSEPPRMAVDDLPNPAEEKRRELREVAIRKVIAGDATVRRRGASEVVKVGETGARGAAAEDQYVELAREKTDKIFVILAEFGNQRDPAYPDQDTDPNTPGPARFDGPLHNQIPAPDRSKDNSTVWQANYNPAHYRDLYFGTSENSDSLKKYYERQSSGRYSVDGTVTSWVKVPYNEARYGRSDGFPCDDNVCDNTWDLIRDAINQWVADQEAAGRTDDADQEPAQVLRPVGPQRLRPRRQLQRGRRLHRPLPDRPRGRRPGGRRPVPGRGRHLVAPLEGLPEHGSGPGGEQGRRNADR